MRGLTGLAIGLLLGGCAWPQRDAGAPKSRAPKPRAIVTVDASPPATWRTIVMPDDERAIDMLDGRWREARAAARLRYAARVTDEGPLLDPAAAQPLPALSPGTYLCRLVRLGGRPAYVTYRPNYCVVDGDDKAQSFTKQDGPGLPGGWLFADDVATRLVFLGTNRPHARLAAAPYGKLPTGNVAGIVERIGAFRWRLVIAQGASRPGAIDIYDLMPVVPIPPSMRIPSPQRSSGG